MSGRTPPWALPTKLTLVPNSMSPPELEITPLFRLRLQPAGRVAVLSVPAPVWDVITLALARLAATARVGAVCTQRMSEPSVISASCRR